MSTEAKDLVAVEPPSISPYVGLFTEAIKAGQIEIASKMMDLQERWEDRQAEKAFVAALAAFKRKPPEITKNKKVSYTNKQNQLVEYKHATLDRVTVSIAAGLGEHGLSADWETTQENGKIRVSCFLQHVMGHREKRASLEAPPDDSGGKGTIHAIASTVTYLERYTLLAATGLATRDDADGITFGDAEDMLNSIGSAADLEELQDRYNKAYKRAHMAKDKNAMAIAIEAKDRRKAELTGKTVPKSQATPENPEAKVKFEEFQALCQKKGLNEANRHMLLGKHENIDAAIAELKGLPDPSTPEAGAAQVPTAGEKAEPARKGRAKKAEAPGAKAPETSAAAAVAPASSAAPKEPEYGF